MPNKATHDLTVVAPSNSAKSGRNSQPHHHPQADTNGFHRKLGKSTSSSVFSTILNPKSIAVIGASRHPSKVGYQVLKNIITSGYRGQLFPINPNAKKILGLKCHPTISHLDKAPELAIIITPASLVPIILKEAAYSNIKSAIIITAGFAEVGPKGEKLQQQLSQITSSSNIRVLGPNCLGALSTHYRLNATFGPSLPKKGSTMLISQSGAMVTGILDWAADRKLGISHAITFGNRIDINENEALIFAKDDINTNIILLYLESFSNPKKFFSLASSITPHKPIIILKGGQSHAGQRASASHTAALASDYALTRSFARQTGVILVDTLQQFLNIASLFTLKKPIKGLDLAIVTNAGGPGVISTDKAISSGLNIVPVSKKTSHLLHLALNLNRPKNPIDILGDALPEDFTSALNIIDQDTIQDTILVIITPQTTTKPAQTARAITAFSKQSTKPVFVVLIGGKTMSSAKKILTRSNIPVYDYPKEAIELISLHAKYRAHIEKLVKFPQKISPNTNKKLAQKLASNLNLNNAFSLLIENHITIPPYRIINSSNDIHSALTHVGIPAVLKTADLSILHKQKAGGVFTHIMNTSQARLAYRKLATINNQVLVQKMIAHQGEIIIGAKNDPHFGIFITIGLGGSFTDTLKDRGYAFFPTTKNYLKSVFAETKAYSLVSQSELLTKQVINVVYSLGLILFSYSNINEIEINPLLIASNKLYATDIKIQLKPH